MTILDKEFIGKKFKEYRKKACLTQEEISEKIGIAEKHYGKLERGIFSPSLETFFKITETLEIPLIEFGIEQKSDNSDNYKEQLLKEIYLLNEKEIKLFSNILNSIKDFQNK